ncbi:carbon storage regulator [Leifsonia xyli subsp. xyli]|uniref:Translational regulator CsrA n=2 Tax=Leifsonia xyli subsp. xyli TaxID=59736 RepID=CSRA_LEIXX|nr:carbon storage regulator CsrA [Leifsonia xyli]Q6AG99.1 RecName: Full=Translational regulator CsrA [Leifsonia xyli subsp. xyli str. CTCB07]AAT88596.1 carbon storage regulator, CsrA family [Leifsonia xyli subsp. xyli str. CTCB07]ODA90542.1 carbon storage regulator [Leifsonia xyli subsp. xyli]
MLVLTRKQGEKILIGDDIEITVLDTRGDGIRIGISAPRGIRIQRDEVRKAIEAENRSAAMRNPAAEFELIASLTALQNAEDPPPR